MFRPYCGATVGPRCQGREIYFRVPDPLSSPRTRIAHEPRVIGAGVREWGSGGEHAGHGSAIGNQLKVTNVIATTAAGGWC